MSIINHERITSNSKYIKLIIDDESDTESIDDIDNECCICFESLDKKDLATLNCNHKYHYECIGNWMSSIQINNIKTEDNFCPLCPNGTEIINVVCRDKVDPKKIQFEKKKSRKKTFLKIFKKIFRY
jgi:hypothetical protein